MNKKQTRKMVKSETHMKATAQLEQEVQKELEIPDPSPEKAEAILRDTEKTDESQHQ